MKELTEEMVSKICESYSRSKNRLLLLDYDGTLVSFADKPERAKPDKELIGLLMALSQPPQNEIVIISGRNKGTLDKWLSFLNIGLVAEHGAWVKERGKDWEAIGPLKNDWKKEIRPILEVYVDRTPGSFIEEKDFSLVWHYRNCDPALAAVRAKELKNVLLKLATNGDVSIMNGNKVIEIKNININKGRALLRWISKKQWDFILVIGDDSTDEDMFAALPYIGYSIKVGFTSSHAELYVKSVAEVRSLLSKLAGFSNIWF